MNKKLSDKKNPDNDVVYMKEAITEAKKSLESDDVPVGAVIVCDGKIIARAHNIREAENISVGHAEIIAIEEACKKLKSWHLEGCTLYVTLEPCVMCAGAIMNSRIEKVVFGAKDAKAGACISVININSYPFGFKPDFKYGVCEEECRQLIVDFFKNKRV